MTSSPPSSTQSAAGAALEVATPTPTRNLNRLSIAAATFIAELDLAHARRTCDRLLASARGDEQTLACLQIARELAAAIAKCHSAACTDQNVYAMIEKEDQLCELHKALNAAYPEQRLP